MFSIFFEILLAGIILGLMGTVAFVTVCSPATAFFLLFYTSDYDNALAMVTSYDTWGFWKVVIALLVLFGIILVGLQSGRFLSFSLCYSFICVFVYSFSEGFVQYNVLLAIAMNVVALVISFFAQRLINVHFWNESHFEDLCNSLSDNKPVHIFSTLMGTLLIFLNMVVFVYIICTNTNTERFLMMSGPTMVRVVAIISGCATVVVSLIYHMILEWLD